MCFVFLSDSLFSLWHAFAIALWSRADRNSTNSWTRTRMSLARRPPGPLLVTPKSSSLFQLEKHFSNPRDIEWAVKDDTVYLLQVKKVSAAWPSVVIFWPLALQQRNAIHVGAVVVHNFANHCTFALHPHWKTKTLAHQWNRSKRPNRAHAHE